jgi:putative heme-binding domain-containing protein
MRGGVIAGMQDEVLQKSGILSDTPELTTIRIATVREKMAYDVTELTVKPGKKVKLTFANPDFMPHNILLVNPGKADEVGVEAVALGAGGFAVNYVPENDNILWSSKLVDHGKEEVIEFTAPTTEGAYPYICSFPGHHLLMRGTLYVTEDLEAFRAKNPEVATKVTPWKAADLEADLPNVSKQRNFAVGQATYMKLACAQCHQIGISASVAGPDLAIQPSTDGSKTAPVVDGMVCGPTLAIGPNLTDVVKKYKGDPKAILQEILEPSKNIEEKYRKVMLVLDDDTIVSGNVVSEDDDSITLQTGSTATQQQKVSKDEIVAEQFSPVSIMPDALLNTLDKEQILDLLAFVLNDGNPMAAAFKP